MHKPIIILLQPSLCYVRAHVLQDWLGVGVFLPIPTSSSTNKTQSSPQFRPRCIDILVVECANGPLCVFLSVADTVRIN